MDWRKASLSSSAACGPSGLLGELSRNLRRLLQPRLDRVSTPVTELVPDAYRHSFCAAHIDDSLWILSFTLPVRLVRGSKLKGCAVVFQWASQKLVLDGIN